MNSYREILKLVWPLALGMINNAVLQFTDRMFLAHDSVEALEALDPDGGRNRGIEAGANVIMPVLTPEKYRKCYDLYPGQAGREGAPRTVL